MVKTKRIISTIELIVLIIGTILMLFPFTWMILTSFKTGPESVMNPPTWLPVNGWHPENYPAVFEAAPFGRYFLNTFIVALLSTVLSLFISITAAYALSLHSFKGSGVILTFFIATMMVPEEILIIQNYVTIADMHLMDTFLGIVLPGVANGMYIYLLRETFMSFPAALRKAAKVDGCSDVKFLIRVLLPNCISTLTTIGLLTFIGAWNNFLWPLMVTNYDSHRVLTIGLMQFNTGASSRINLQMAGATVIVIPVIVIYLIFRKQIIQGVASGGVKG